MKQATRTLCTLLAAIMVTLQLPVQSFADDSPLPGQGSIVINEVESNAPDNGNDWVEITNIGTDAVDISGWYLTDDGGTGRKDEGKTTPLPDGTVLQPGDFLVLEENVNFTFGLGKADAATLYNGNDEQIDNYTYTAAATGTWSRQEDGSFVDADATKGAANASSVTPEPVPESKSVLVLNEINSSPDDWVELMNTGTTTLDLSGYELRDNSDDHRWRFPDESLLDAEGLLVVDAKSIGLIYDDQAGAYVSGTFEEAISIGSGDSIRLYDRDGKLLDEYSWTEHASYDGDAALASYGRYPNGTG